MKPVAVQNPEASFTNPPTMITPPRASFHWPALDGLRGLAVLAVIAFHAELPLNRGGFHGVDIFLVLSGFLITTFLIREHQKQGAIHLGRFYLRRTLRLLPALAAVLAGCWLFTRVEGLVFERVTLENDLPGILLFYYNWCEILQPPRSTLVCHLWSLSVEEQFYLLWPGLLMLLLACRLRRRWIVAVTLIGLVVPPMLRLTWFGLPHSYYGTDSRMDALAAGCLLGLLAGWGMTPGRYLSERGLRLGAWVAAGLLLGHLTFSYPGHYAAYVGHTLCTLSSMMLIAALVWSPPRFLARLFAWAPLRWTGRISYGAYLWHLPVIFVAVHIWGYATAHAWGGLLLTATLFLGAASYYLVEWPFLKWKGRLNRNATAVLHPMPTSVPRVRAA